MALQKVEGEKGYLKDKATGNVVNVDNSHYTARRKKILAEKQKAEEIVSLQSEVAELKDMVNQLMNK